jgi:drug/metabolite transporter (DMT)-like permease
VAHASRFLSIPQATAAKASKLLPTMMISSLIWRKQYNLRDWFLGGLTAFGLSMTLTSDGSYSSVTANPLSGGSLMFTSLTLDAIGTNAQEQLLLLGSERTEVAFFQMGVSTVLNCSYGILFGTLYHDMVFALSNFRILLALGVFSFLSYHCNRTYLNMIYMAGSSPTQLTMCLVKAVSIVLSFAIYPKPISSNQIIGMVIVFSSVIGLLFFPPSAKQLQLVIHETEEVMRTSLKLTDGSSKRETPPSSPLAGKTISKPTSTTNSPQLPLNDQSETYDDSILRRRRPQPQGLPPLHKSTSSASLPEFRKGKEENENVDRPRIKIKIPTNDLHGLITGLSLPDDSHRDLLSPFHAHLTPMKQQLIQKEEERTKSSQEMIEPAFSDPMMMIINNEGSKTQVS